MPIRQRFWNRRICRALFVVLGIVPLLASVGWATYHQLHFREANVQAWLAGQLGLDCSFLDLVTARPGQCRIQELRVVDPETRELIGSASQLAWCEIAHGRYLHVPSMEVPAANVHRLIQLLHDRILKQRRLLTKPIEFQADTVVLKDGESTQFIHDLRVDIQLDPHGPEATVAFRWPDQAPDERVELQLHRDHRSESPRTVIRLETGAASLPCSCVTAWLPWLTAPTQFQGNVKATIATDALHLHGCDADISGHLTQLPLSITTSGDVSHLIAKNADVIIRRALFQDGQAQMVEGSITAVDGQLPVELLAAGQANQLWVCPTIHRDSTSQFVEFDRLSIDFQLNDDQSFLRSTGALTTTDGMVSLGTHTIVSAIAAPVSLAGIQRTLLGLTADVVPVPLDHPVLRFIPDGQTPTRSP